MSHKIWHTPDVTLAGFPWWRNEEEVTKVSIENVKKAGILKKTKNLLILTDSKLSKGEGDDADYIADWTPFCSRNFTEFCSNLLLHGKYIQSDDKLNVNHCRFHD